MRIRNSRAPPSLAPPLEAVPRSTSLRSRLRSQFDERFLVEEEIRRIGWSCCLLRKSTCPVSSEDQLHDELEQTTGERRSMNCVDEEKDMKHCMLVNSNLALKEHCEVEDNKGKEFSLSADSQGDGDSSTLLVKVGISFPSTFPEIGSESGEELPFKKRQIIKLSENRTKEVAEGALVEVEVADVKEAKEGGRISLEMEDETSEVKVEDALVEVKVEDATVGVGEENTAYELKRRDVKKEFEVECIKTELQQEKEKTGMKDEAITIEEKMETENIHERGDLNEVNGCQKTQSINCIINYESYFPCVVNGDKLGNLKHELGLEDTDAEPTGRPLRERKREGTNQSADSNSLHLNREKQKPRRGRPKRVQDHAVDGNMGCTDKPKPKRGLPKRVIDESWSGDNWDAEKPKPKRGRPKKVKDEDQNRSLQAANMKTHCQ